MRPYPIKITINNVKNYSLVRNDGASLCKLLLIKKFLTEIHLRM